MDIKKIKKLIALAIKSDLTEFEYSEGEVKVKIVRGLPPQIQLPMSAPQLLPGQLVNQPGGGTATGQPAGTSADQSVAESPVTEQYEQITSPMVGTFYRASAPDAEPFVEIDSIIEPEKTVCIIEAMKLMNEIKAEFKCKIISVLVENGQPVEFGQPLFKIQRL